MIVRIFRARIREGKLADWQQRVETHSIPWMQAQKGLIAFYPGRPVDKKAREFSMTSVWEDVDAIRKAVGEDWQRPVLLADEAELVEAVDMHHYETFGL